MENSIEEALEKLSTGKKIKLDELLRIFKREGIENFVIARKKYIDVILSDYKRVLKENEELNEKILSNTGIYELGFRDGEKRYIQKIREKIEEITQKIKYEENEKVLIQLHKQRKVLQELIKKED